jgi:putative ABC transport system permease protein
VDVQVEPLRTGIALLLLLAATFAVMTVGGLGYRKELAIAAVRAFVQLIAVALVIAWIFTHPEGAFAYLAVMLVVAAWTSTRRIGGDRRDGVSVLLAIFLGAGATVTIVATTGALVFSAETLLPFTAQMIGGAMTTASLAGVRLRDDVRDQLLTFEGYVALGATYRQAGRAFARRASERSLFPTLDQTKSAGLVTLPGAFVGMLLGGASPLQAAQVQLLVLIGLLLVQAITAVVTTRLISPLPPGLGANVADVQVAR